LLTNIELQLIVLDVFATYKKSTKKDEKEAKDLVNEFEKLNTTISVIPRGCTSYFDLWMSLLIRL
jgi:hypothetical protein